MLDEVSRLPGPRAADSNAGVPAQGYNEPLRAAIRKGWQTMMSTSANKAKVLVVEDDTDVAGVMRLILEEDGWDVQVAPDGAAAKELIASMTTPPDLITLDIGLPDTTGEQLILEFKSSAGWERIPIIMVTARPRSGEPSWAIKSGAKAYLVKPIDPDDLRKYARRFAPKSAAL